MTPLKIIFFINNDIKKIKSKISLLTNPKPIDDFTQRTLRLWELFIIVSVPSAFSARDILNFHFEMLRWSV